jgi:hypothetical protein
MTKIICIHGIAQELQGSELLAREWRAALRDGMRFAGADANDLPSDSDINVAFYGDLFRGRKKSTGAGGTPYELVDIEPGFESELLSAWADAAEAHQYFGLPAKGGGAPRSIQRIATTLLKLPYFLPLADRCLVGSLKQVRWYLAECETRKVVRERLSSLITADTRLVIGHSLGSVVAYEVLCQMLPPIAPAFITLGSPLGLPKLVFDRLDPAPVNGRGCWPGSTTTWTNIAANNDIVAAVKSLAPLFVGSVQDVTVNNEAKAHDILPYLTAAETGTAALKALRAF